MKEVVLSFLAFVIVGMVLFVAMGSFPDNKSLWFAAFIWTVGLVSLLSRMFGTKAT